MKGKFIPSISDTSTSLQDTIEVLVRNSRSKIIAQLIHQFKDFDIAEDAFQESIIVAFNNWPITQIPDDPEAWVFITAQRKAIDIIRKNRRNQNKHDHYKKFHPVNIINTQSIDNKTAYVEKNFLNDHRLALIFTCCHPALDQNSQVALTLHTICGFTTEEIAKTYLVKTSTIAQRLVRAKKKIKVASIPYQEPEPQELANRLTSVLSVLYLIFNEAYYSSGSLYIISKDLAQETIRMASIINLLLPKQAELLGLLSLMLFSFSRFGARLDKFGRAIKLVHQNRSLWGQAEIKQADAYLRQATSLKQLGPFQIQAAISGIHSNTPEYKNTDWSQIYLLYEKLYQYQASPIVKLNAAVAIAQTDNLKLAYKIIHSLNRDGKLDDYHPFYIVKAHICKLMGNNCEAKENLTRAITACHNRSQSEQLLNELETLPH